MNANEYRDKAMRTECNQLAPLGRLMANPELVRLLHATMRLSNETGELAGLVERVVWYGTHSLDEIRERVKNELGDVAWGLAQACTALGLTIEEVLAANIAKLAVRYPERFSAERSRRENRDDEAEQRAVSVKATIEDGKFVYVGPTTGEVLRGIQERTNQGLGHVNANSCGEPPVVGVYNCGECGSRGFRPSITGVGCTFCDGTEGGNPPRQVYQDGHGFGHADEGETK